MLARPSFYLPETQSSSPPPGEKLLVMKAVVPLNQCFAWELQDTGMHLIIAVFLLLSSLLLFVDCGRDVRMLINQCALFAETKRNYSFEIVRTDGKGSKRILTVSTSSLEEKNLWVTHITDAALRFPFAHFYFEETLLSEL